MWKSVCWQELVFSLHLVYGKAPTPRSIVTDISFVSGVHISSTWQMISGQLFFYSWQNFIASSSMLLSKFISSLLLQSTRFFSLGLLIVSFSLSLSLFHLLSLSFQTIFYSNNQIISWLSFFHHWPYPLILFWCNYWLLIWTLPLLFAFLLSFLSYFFHIPTLVSHACFLLFYFSLFYSITYA